MLAMTLEHERRPRIEEVNVQEDPLRKQRNTAVRINKSLQVLGTTLEIRALGAFHQGIIGQDIRDEIVKSDVVTFELESGTVRQGRQGVKGKALSKNPFWATVLDVAHSEQRKTLGANNNRASVNGIRLLGDRWRKDQKIFESAPDMVISARGHSQEIQDLIRGATISPHATGEPYLAIIPRRLDDFAPTDRPLPHSTTVEGSDGPIYAHWLKPFSEDKSTVLVVVGDWYSPMEFAHTKFDDLMAGHEELFPNVYDLADFGTQHLMRLRGDKTQVDGMLDEVDKELKRRIAIGDRRPMVATHIGGIAHNANILGILQDLFGEDERVVRREIVDARIVPLPLDMISFFSRVVPVREGLAAAEIFNDTILINGPKALSVLRDGLERGKEALKPLFLRNEIVDEYSRGKEMSTQLELEIEVMEYLLSFLPNEILESLKTSKKESYWDSIFGKVLALYPEKKDEVLEAIACLRDVKVNFPPEPKEKFLRE